MPDAALLASVPQQYLEDASGLCGHAERLLIPTNEMEVAAALRDANAAGIPVTIAGAGTGVTGARVPFGGWVLSLERFTRLEIHSGSPATGHRPLATGYAVVGAGVLLRDLHAAAQRSGQFYPPDPTETGSAIGGNIATNASGARSFRYGATRRWVERLRVVLADGRVLDAGRGDGIDFDPGTVPLPQVTKNTAGYLLRPGMDWVDLFIGSEGTLGVIVEATVRLLPAPAAVLAGVVFFAGDDAAVDAVERWRETAPARMLEYMDLPSLNLLRSRFPEIPKEAGAAILFDQELVSDEDPEVDHWLDRIQSAGALVEASWFATTERDRERFRRFRHALPELVNETVRRNGAMKMNSDYAVPLARNREMLAYYRARLEAEFPGRYVIFGHIGDAHVHVNIFSDPEKPAQASDLLLEFARHAVDLGGTVSAEHGVGKRKAHLLKLQYAPEHLEAMRAVKRRLDPNHILGRGTVLG
jgi:FAD/FMN-containing dehydrogenase